MANENQGLPVGDRKENMKKLLVVLSVVNGVLAVFVGVLVCLVLPRREFDFDYLGFMVGVLGVLFAVVLAFNIYSLIDLRGLIEQNRQNAEEIKGQRKVLRNAFVQLESELGKVYYQQRFLPSDKNLVRNSLYHLIKAVAITANDKEFQECGHLIEEIKYNYTSGGQITAKDKEDLLDCVRSIPNKDMIANFEKLKGVIDSLTVVQ
ncbi:MAG: hypothetical protein IKK04_10255 [Bacteroidales bacterium]|nr:hypothetical protein [Bacteroidales bacterium]